MKKLSYLLAFFVVCYSSLALAEEGKAPQDQIGKAAVDAADNAGKGAGQLGSDVSKGTGNILEGVGKFLQKIGRDLIGAPTLETSHAQPTASQTPNQQPETQTATAN